MTAAATSNLVLSAPPQRKPKVTFGDLLALTVRQQRFALASIVLLYLAYGGWIAANGGAAEIGYWRFDPKIFVPGLAGLVAVFWGAPLLATEYEQHTNLLAWSQDVSGTRWLVTKLTVLGGTVIVLSAALTMVERIKIGQQSQGDQWWGAPNSPFGFLGFEDWVPLAIAYAVFGFVLGVAVGAVSRRVVTSLAVTLVGFAGVRLLVIDVVRPWLLANLITPARNIWPVKDLVGPPTQAVTASQPGPRDYLVINQMWLTSKGDVLPAVGTCWNRPEDSNGFARCLADQGIVSGGSTYQPVSRLIRFQVTELVIYLVLIALCLGIAIWSVRRRAST
ncbi:MAG TPA: hypothetical protein VJ914_28210 [Pseudonocardiaceae bacterium]|nr:hypothetical protein [Pseudonocardiaceae bacterium]